jgi:hypothetical protein
VSAAAIARALVNAPHRSRCSQPDYGSCQSHALVFGANPFHPFGPQSCLRVITPQPG